MGAPKPLHLQGYDAVRSDLEKHQYHELWERCGLDYRHLNKLVLLEPAERDRLEVDFERIFPDMYNIGVTSPFPADQGVPAARHRVGYSLHQELEDTDGGGPHTRDHPSISDDMCMRTVLRSYSPAQDSMSTVVSEGGAYGELDDGLDRLDGPDGLDGLDVSHAARVVREGGPSQSRGGIGGTGKSSKAALNNLGAERDMSDRKQTLCADDINASMQEQLLILRKVHAQDSDESVLDPHRFHR